MERIECLNMRDLDQVESLMNQLSQIQKEANDAIQVVYDEQGIIQKSLILNGGMGWKIETQAMYNKMIVKVEKVKKSMQKMLTDLVDQQQTSFDLINSNSTSHDLKIHLENTLHSRIVTLIEKHKVLND